MPPDTPDRTPWLAGATAKRLALGSLAAGIVLSVVASRRQLLLGESTITRWLLVHAEPSLGPLTSVLDDAFTDLTATAIFAALALVVLVLWDWWETSIFLLAGAFTVVARLGNLVQRPRPNGRLEWGPVVDGAGGYPSGHVVYFVLVFGTLAFFVWEVPSRLPRRATVGVLVAAIVAVGPARVVQLDHWPIDVVGGYLLAFPGLVAAACAYQLGPPRYLNRLLGQGG